MLGYVGDPRRLPMNETTGGEQVPFGTTGGKCGLAGFAGKNVYAFAAPEASKIYSEPGL